MSLPVPHLDDDLVVDLLLGSLKHILFIMELIPVPFEQLKLSEELTHRRAVKRKVEHLIEQFMMVEQDLKVMSSRVGVEDAQIIFGPSVTSPKMIFSFHFPPSRADNASTIITDKKRKACMRKVIRSFIEHWTDEASSHHAKQTNVFLAIKSIGKDPDSLHSAVGDTLRFRLRQCSGMGFVENLRKKAPPPHHIWLSCDHSSYSNGIEIYDHEMVPWFVMVKGIKGLKCKINGAAA